MSENKCHCDWDGCPCAAKFKALENGHNPRIDKLNKEMAEMESELATLKAVLGKAKKIIQEWDDETDPIDLSFIDDALSTLPKGGEK